MYFQSSWITLFQQIQKSNNDYYTAPKELHDYITSLTFFVPKITFAATTAKQLNVQNKKRILSDHDLINGYHHP